MNKRCSRRTGVTSENGYTLIFAVIIMAMLTIVSAAVLTSAANSLNAVNRRIDGRQAYYIAKSVLNTVDTSLKSSGGLGSVIRNEVYDAAASGKKEASLTASINLSGDIGDFTIEDVHISLDEIRMQDKGTPNTNVQDKSIDAYMNISYTAKTKSQKYKLTARYKFSAVRSVNNNDNKITWSDVKWELKDIGQK